MESRMGLRYRKEYDKLGKLLCMKYLFLFMAI